MDHLLWLQKSWTPFRSPHSWTGLVSTTHLFLRPLSGLHSGITLKCSLAQHTGFSVSTSALIASTITSPLAHTSAHFPNLFQMNRCSVYKGRALPHRSLIGWQLQSITLPQSDSVHGQVHSHSDFTALKGRGAPRGQEGIIHFNRNTKRNIVHIQ